MDARPLRADRHASPSGSWEMIHAAPAPGLWPEVRRYCGYEEHSAMPVRRREVPAPQVTVILSLGPSIDVFRSSASTDARQSLGSFVASVDDAPALTQHIGHQHGVQINLGPLTAHRLFAMPMHELTGRVVELEEVWGRPGRQLAEMLHAAPGWEARFDMLDRFIAGRLSESPPPPRELSWAWGRLRRIGGSAPIGALASELDWSPRRVVREFRTGVGMAPKALARLLRFERVTQRLNAEGRANLGQIALECGYYDQPHLNRDFRQFAGISPGEYAASVMPAGGGVSA
jgi:AraC-like DNA-binding protein